MTRPLAIALILIIPSMSGDALAQDHAPYGGLEPRAIKALSPQQIADLPEGRGMGLALPAELDGYPGPMHVLEHADALGLSAAQRGGTQAALRAAHLRAHIAQRALLSDEQANRYAELRGYGGTHHRRH